ncbi:hypothetical protein Efla_007535 [Eimeria flavescens]
MLPQLASMQQQLGEEVAAARANVLQRQPPSAAAEAELEQQQERQRKKRQIVKEMEEARQQEKEKALSRSSAPLRPVFYLPEERLENDGLPRAYGALKPFLPPPPSVNLKFYEPQHTPEAEAKT